MLKGKCVVIGVSGSIAAYKAACLVSALVKAHADVEVIMTENATRFINPITFETLTGRKCLVDTFDRNFSFDVEHVSLAKRADLFMVAPATANVLGKMACGIADDMLTTTLLACRCPVFAAPAMNTAMYENPVVQDNIRRLREFGIRVIEPAEGRLACGDTGPGKMPEPEELLSYILRELACEKDLAGKKVLVTAGPTREAIDPVRFLTNRSTGKMGYAIARRAMLRGADVTLVSGPTALEPPEFVTVVQTESAAQMYREVTARSGDSDMIFMCAAVADYTPPQASEQKIKKQEGGMTLVLERTEDILAALGKTKKAGQFLCGFAMETEDLLERAAKKLADKSADMIVANSLRTAGAGFGTDTNVASLVTGSGVEELQLMSKEALGDLLLDRALDALGG